MCLRPGVCRGSRGGASLEGWQICACPFRPLFGAPEPAPGPDRNPDLQTDPALFCCKCAAAIRRVRADCVSARSSAAARGLAQVIPASARIRDCLGSWGGGHRGDVRAPDPCQRRARVALGPIRQAGGHHSNRSLLGPPDRVCLPERARQSGATRLWRTRYAESQGGNPRHLGWRQHKADLIGGRDDARRRVHDCCTLRTKVPVLSVRIKRWAVFEKSVARLGVVVLTSMNGLCPTICGKPIRQVWADGKES